VIRPPKDEQTLTISSRAVQAYPQKAISAIANLLGLRLWPAKDGTPSCIGIIATGQFDLNDFGAGLVSITITADPHLSVVWLIISTLGDGSWHARSASVSQEEAGQLIVKLYDHLQHWRSLPDAGDLLAELAPFGVTYSHSSGTPEKIT